MQVSSPANLFSLAVCVNLTLSRYPSLLSNVITHVTSLRLQTLFDHMGGFCIFYFAILGLVEGVQERLLRFITYICFSGIRVSSHFRLLVSSHTSPNLVLTLTQSVR
ncbi:uncharacterized protein [Spinacia oleracea]|uniref:Uncharacterized protein n=1 Tax=Spinacia oleracea TaxID=3562 RepID=A0ABM3RUK1_SPIOL|nr:uncharacterized protein LOC130472420 [Spinacia oleracea]